jgi:hypothetical protein
MSGEIPKGLTKAVADVKERPQYARKILVDQVGELCFNIFEAFSTKNGGSRYRFLKPVGRIVDRDYVVVKLEENVNSKGWPTTETLFKIAVNPSNIRIPDEKEFATLFTDSGFGVRNMWEKDAGIDELNDYLEILEYYKTELAKTKKDK